jgi:hypothetical protein
LAFYDDGVLLVSDTGNAALRVVPTGGGPTSTAGTLGTVGAAFGGITARGSVAVAIVEGDVEGDRLAVLDEGSAVKRVALDGGVQNLVFDKDGTVVAFLAHDASFHAVNLDDGALGAALWGGVEGFRNGPFQGARTAAPVSLSTHTHGYVCADLASLRLIDFDAQQVRTLLGDEFALDEGDFSSSTLAFPTGVTCSGLACYVAERFDVRLVDRSHRQVSLFIGESGAPRANVLDVGIVDDGGEKLLLLEEGAGEIVEVAREGQAHPTVVVGGRLGLRSLASRAGSNNWYFSDASGVFQASAPDEKKASGQAALALSSDDTLAVGRKLDGTPPGLSLLPQGGTPARSLAFASSPNGVSSAPTVDAILSVSEVALVDDIVALRFDDDGDLFFADRHALYELIADADGHLDDESPVRVLLTSPGPLLQHVGCIGGLAWDREAHDLVVTDRCSGKLLTVRF